MTPTEKSGRSLREAVVTAIVLLGLVAIFYFLGTDAFFILAFVVVMLALFELFDALIQAGHRPNQYFGLLCGAGMMVVAYAERPAYLAIVIAATMYGSFLLTLRPGRGERPASDVAWTVLGVAWIGGGGAGAVSILALHHSGLELLIGTVLVTALDDIGAYFAGTRFGKHKLAPSISPAKSWEGFVGGIGTALAGGAVFGLMSSDLSILDGLTVGGIASVLAPVGDLVESLVKRQIGIKDTGRLLPGHGGMLDRLDAIIFCCPAIYLYLHFVVF